MREESNLQISFADIKAIAKQMVSKSLSKCLTELVQECCAVGLFEYSDYFFWSPRLRTEAAQYERIRKVRQIAGSKGGQAIRMVGANAKQPRKQLLSEGSEGSDLKERKKDIISIPQKFDIPALEAQFSKEIVAAQMPVLQDWLKSSGKKYKDWQAFARNWMRRANTAPSRNGSIPHKETNIDRAKKVMLKIQQEENEQAGNQQTIDNNGSDLPWLRGD